MGPDISHHIFVNIYNKYDLVSFTHHRPCPCYYQRIVYSNHFRTHTEEKPSQCFKFDQAFSHNTNTRTHMRTHIGENPFQCSNYDKTISHTCNILIDQMTHTGDKPIHCSYCGNAFNCNGYLVTHQRTHTG